MAQYRNGVVRGSAPRALLALLAALAAFAMIAVSFVSPAQAAPAGGEGAISGTMAYRDGTDAPQLSYIQAYDEDEEWVSEGDVEPDGSFVIEDLPPCIYNAIRSNAEWTQRQALV